MKLGGEKGGGGRKGGRGGEERGKGVGGGGMKKKAGIRESSKPPTFRTLHSRLPTPFFLASFLLRLMPPVPLPTSLFPHKSDSFALIFKL